MTTIAALELVEDIPVNENLPPSQSLLQQYEKMIVTTLLRSFALDFMFRDQDGGNIDTPLTARKYGLKDQEAKKRYNEKSEYKDVKGQYHQHKNYRKRNEEATNLRRDGKLVDSYTGQLLPRNETQDLDHTIAAKYIHEDPAVYLINLNGVDLANADTNLNHTNYSINRSKKQKDMTLFITDLKAKQEANQTRINELKQKDALTDREQGELKKLENISKANISMMDKADKTARKTYEKAIRTDYLKNKETWNKLKKDAASQGFKMGLRQVVGVLLSEVWVIVRTQLPQIVALLKRDFSIKVFFEHVGQLFKESFNMVRSKYKELIQAFSNGVLAGIMSSLSTFFVNFFVGTTKNVVKIIRESWGSITEVFTLLALNPDKLNPGELMTAISKILVMAASVAAGTLVGESFSKLPIAQVPVVGEALTTFISGVITGILSISLLYFIDHSRQVGKLVDYINTFSDQLEKKQTFYEDLHANLVAKAAELAVIPITDLHRQVTYLRQTTTDLTLAKTIEGKNDVISSVVSELQLDLPYENKEGLKNLMNDKMVTLQF